MTLNDYCDAAHKNAIAKGFYKRNRELPELLMLVVSELSEAMEADRKNIKYDIDELNCFAQDYNECETWDAETARDYASDIRGTVPEEIADACIRLFDLCAYYDIDLDAHVKAKMRYNATRPRMHGKRY